MLIWSKKLRTMTKSEIRLEKELSIVSSRNFVTIKQLATELEVSEMTIRRDVASLVKMNRVNCVYGGVVPIKPVYGGTAYTLQNEKEKNWDVKLLIAKKAMSLICPEDVLFFDTGSTVQALAEQITNDYSYTFITSSFNSLAVLTQLTNSTVITPGGVFSQKPKVFYDLNSVNAIKRYRANKCFIGATGYDKDLGITCSYLEDAPIKQTMMECSKQNILLIDSTKFGAAGTCQFASINQFSIVITDSGIPDSYKELIKENNVSLMIADQSD